MLLLRVGWRAHAEFDYRTLPKSPQAISGRRTGAPGDAPVESLVSDGRPVIGFHMRSGLIVDAIGLLLRDL